MGQRSVRIVRVFSFPDEAGLRTSVRLRIAGVGRERFRPTCLGRYTLTPRALHPTSGRPQKGDLWEVVVRSGFRTSRITTVTPLRHD